MPVPAIRRLRRFDQSAITAHFLRLDQSTLRLRFFAAVGEDFVRQYSNDILNDNSLIYGAFADRKIRALAELRRIPDSCPMEYEAAFSVEPGWQDQGIGDALLTRLVAVAQNRGIKSLHMICLPENAHMQHLARKHRAVLHFQPGEAEATLLPHWPTPLSLSEEVTGEYNAFARAVFTWAN